MTHSSVMKTFKILIGTAGAVLITGFAVEEKAVAVAVNILNAGFESPAAPRQSAGYYYSVNDITSWQVTPDQGSAAGVFNVPASAAGTGNNSLYNQPAPQGSQIAYNNGGTISQQLSTTLAANTTYKLSAFVGRRSDLAFPGYNVVLTAGGNVLAFNDSVTPAPGGFAPLNVTYTSSSSSAGIGQALGISLIAKDGGQIDFDNFALDATANATGSTPVPFEFSPGLGILALGAMGALAQLKSQVVQRLKT